MKVIVALLVMSSLACSASADDCAFRSVPETLINEPGKFLQYQTEEDRPVLWQSVLPDSPALHAFRESVGRDMDVDPIALLKAQAARTEPGSNRNNTLKILHGEAGKIRQMNCLEGVLMARQTDRTGPNGESMYQKPTEFLAYVLTRNAKLKIYFYTSNQAGIGNIGFFSDFLDQDKRDGWSVLFNLHNHNFFPANTNVMGATTPSDNDVQVFRATRDTQGLDSALITNGFDTVELSSKDFDVLYAPGE